jgi:RND family efflux transporter MFP subunit
MKTSDVLSKVLDVLNNTYPKGIVTQSFLDTKKSAIEAARSSMTAQYATLNTQQQAITNAKNSLNNYQIAYDKAVKDLEEAHQSAENSIKLKEEALKQAVANYESRINPPRAVDTALYRAQVAQAVANRDKAYIRAPIDGVVTKINKKVGELMSGGEAMVSLLSPHYEVKVDISEVDVGKLKVGNTSTITLDAFGTDTKITGRVLAIEPGPTIIQDVVYYKVQIGLDETAVALKPGLTANVSIITAERKNVIAIPSRAVKFDEDGGRYVKVLENKEEKQYPVQVGLKADNGKVEISEGLEPGQVVIVSKEEKK